MSLREALRSVDLFRALPESALDELLESGTTFKMNPGNTLVRQGALDEGFQIVRAGSAEVTVDGVVHGILGVGEYFGEMSLIDGAPRSATIVAGPEGVETFAVSALTFSALMDRNPQVARSLLPVLTARIRAAEAAQRSSR